MDVFRNALNVAHARAGHLARNHGSGAILPVKQMCAEARARGIFTVIDGAQAVGTSRWISADIGCDAYVGCFHKWLLAPAGAGFLYLKNGRAPRGVVHAGEFALERSPGRRFPVYAARHGQPFAADGCGRGARFSPVDRAGADLSAREVSRRLSARRTAQDSRHADLYAFDRGDVRRHHGLRGERGDGAALQDEMWTRARCARGHRARSGSGTARTFSTVRKRSIRRWQWYGRWRKVDTHYLLDSRKSAGYNDQANKKRNSLWRTA